MFFIALQGPIASVANVQPAGSVCAPAQATNVRAGPGLLNPNPLLALIVSLAPRDELHPRVSKCFLVSVYTYFFEMK